MQNAEGRRRKKKASKGKEDREGRSFFCPLPAFLTLI
jgi:hypothetical protein